jgi:hypothetical protein
MGIAARVTRRSARWAAAWKAALWLYREGRARLDRLSAAERHEFLELMRKSRGRPSNLAQHERRRIQSLVRRLATGR